MRLKVASARRSWSASSGGEIGGDDSNLHCLFLEQRHAQGFAQHVGQLGRGIFHPLLTFATAQIRMHHVALDRAWPDNRYLDHQVVETARFHARQK